MGRPDAGKMSALIQMILLVQDRSGNLGKLSLPPAFWPPEVAPEEHTSKDRNPFCLHVFISAVYSWGRYRRFFLQKVCSCLKNSDKLMGLCFNQDRKKHTSRKKRPENPLVRVTPEKSFMWGENKNKEEMRHPHMFFFMCFLRPLFKPCLTPIGGPSNTPIDQTSTGFYGIWF